LRAIESLEGYTTKKTLISNQTNSGHLKVAANKGVSAATSKWLLLVAANDPILAATFRWPLLVAANNGLNRRKVNKKFESSLAATLCGRYYAKIAATLKWPLLRREK
jgi:GTPase